MRQQVKMNQKLIVVLIIVIVLVYSVAGTSDRMDTTITAKQQRAVVASWRQP